MISEEFLGAFAETLRCDATVEHASSFADHVLINKLTSKKWLADQLLLVTQPKNVLILGSWYSTYLPYALGANHYTCVDIDASVINLSAKFNERLYGNNDKFTYEVGDAQEWLLKETSQFDVIINTSCEHMSFDMRDIELIPNTFYVLQSNNYTIIKDHINCKTDLNSFIESTGLNNILYSGLKSLAKYDRYMVIGTL